MDARAWCFRSTSILAMASVIAACSGGTPESGPAPGAPSSTGAPANATTILDRRDSERGSDVERPVVTGPIAGGLRGQPFNAMPQALAEEHGYIEEEFFISGEAAAYSLTGAASSDGSWTAQPTTTAPYTTRLVVRRPAEATSFDGVVLVEWLNVSSGQDSDVEFAQVHDELMAHGGAWVGVSAQPVGIEGGTSMAMPGLTATPLKTWDAERYAPLSHPGDDFSYDIFSQAGAAVLHPEGVNPLDGAPIRAVIAAGESQSAARMVTYVNAVHPLADLYDGFLIHSRSSGAARLRAGAVALPQPVFIRSDVGVPVLQLETETDILGLPFIDARQPDTDLLRTWEVAGTAHLDRHLLDYLRSEALPIDRTSTTSTHDTAQDPVSAACGPINEGPQRAVLSKAVADLRTWVLEGTPPATGTPIEVVDGAIARDDLGIARGGIRTPPVDAPLMILRGDNPSAPGYVCSLFGSTTPLDDSTLSRLYADRSEYVEAVRRSADAASEAGFLRDVDAATFVAEAERTTSLP